MRRPAEPDGGFASCWLEVSAEIAPARFCPSPQWGQRDCKPGRIGSSCLWMEGSTAIVPADREKTLRRRVQQTPLSRSTHRRGIKPAARDDDSNTSHLNSKASREWEANAFRMDQGVVRVWTVGAVSGHGEEDWCGGGTETIGVMFAGRWQKKCTVDPEGSISISEVFR